jgi:hypothetical protein
VKVTVKDKTATSASEIGTAFQKVGSSAEALHVPFERISAIVATISSVTREAPETIGTAVKSILSRIESVKQRGYDSEDGTTINQVSTALHAANIELVGANGQFRDFSTVLDELAKKWGSLDDKTQRYIATTVASTTQQSRFLALMSNYGQVIDLTNQALNAAGTTQSKYNIYLEGTQSHIDRLKNAMEGLWSNTFSSNAIQTIIDSLTGLISGVSKVSSSFGLLPTTLGLATTALLLFNKSSMTFALDLIPNMIGGMGKLSTFTKTVSADFRALGVSGTFAVGALSGVRVALTSLLISTGIGAAIAGIAWAVSALVSQQQKLNAEQKQLETQQKTIADNWTNQRDKISSLIAEYDKLDGIKTRTTAQEQEYLKVTEDLSKLMPNLVASIDAKGVSHLKSASAIKQELDYAEKLANLENAKKLTNSKNSFDDIISERKKLQNKYEQINNQINNKDLTGSNTGLAINKLTDNDIASLRIQALGISQEINGATDKLKDNMNSLLGTLLQASGVKFGDDVKAELTKVISSLDTTGLSAEEATKKTFEIGTALKTIQTVSSSGTSNSAALTAYSESLDVLKKDLNLTDSQLKSFIDKINGVKSAIDSSSKSTVDFATSIQTLDKNIDNTDKSLSSLASAYQKLQSGEQLSVSETLKLIEAHPQLLDYLSKHNGLIQDKGAILQEVADIERKSALEEAQNLLNGVTDTQNALEAKRKMYQDFYTKINPFLSTPDFTSKYGKPSDGLTDAEKAQIAGAEQQKKELAVRIALLSQPIDLATYNKSPSKAASTPTPYDTTDKSEIINPYQRDLTAVDAKLKESQSIQNNFNITQKEFRDELSKQIELYKEKQTLVHAEADALRESDVALQHRLDTEKLSQKDRNTLLKQLDDNKNKIMDLSSSWFDYEKSATDANSKITDSVQKESQNRVDQSVKNLSATIDPFTQKIKNLKTTMDSLTTDPAGKVADQNAIIDIYQQEQQQILSNIKALKDLSSTLDVNSDAWSKAQDEIKKYQDQSAQVEADSYALKQKIATDTVDLMKKSYAAEKQAQLDALDTEKKAFDDATQSKIDSIDRLRAAQDYQYTLDKDQDKAQLIQNQINALSLDNSNEAKSKVIDLKQQLADQQDKIDKEQQDNSDKLVKQDLQDKQKAYGQDIQNQKDATTTKYDNLINDDQKWLAVERDIINGHVQGIQTEMNGLIDGLGKYANDGMNAAKNNANQLLTLVSQVKAASANLGGYSATVNSPIAQSNNTITSGTTDEMSWQDKLKRAATDDAYAISEILRAKSVYDADTSTGNTVGANAAHTYADQLRAANARVGSNPLYMDTGGYTGSGEGLAYLHSKELVLSKFDTSNILKVVDFTRDIMSKIKTPDFSSIMSKVAGAGGNNVNLTLYNTFTGDQKGGQDAIGVLVNGLKRLGVNINQ